MFSSDHAFGLVVTTRVFKIVPNEQTSDARSRRRSSSSDSTDVDAVGDRDVAFAASTKNVGITDHRSYGMTREVSGPMLRELLDPQIDFALRLLLGVAVTRLKKAEQFTAFAVGEFNIVISQLAPMRPKLGIEQLPIFFDFIPVHESLLIPRVH
jgi:hypothetical protein